jgi:ABC-2 type transport system permease protein
VDAGWPRAGPCTAHWVLLAGLALVLGVACGGAVGLGGRHVVGVTWAGAMVFGATIAATFLVVGALTAVLAQVAATARQARVLGVVAVGASFAVRAFGDLYQVETLSRLSPLGLRAAVEPFTADRWWAIGLAVLAAFLLVGLADGWSARREFGAGLLRRPDSRSRRLRLRTPVGLATRIDRSSLLAWTAGVAAIGTLFSSMGSGTVQQSRKGDLGGFLGAQLGTGDPAAAYLAYCNTVVGILVCAYAVLSVLAAQRSERNGLTDLVLTTGVRRWAPLAAQTLVTAAGCAAILVVTGMFRRVGRSRSHRRRQRRGARLRLRNRAVAGGRRHSRLRRPVHRDQPTSGRSGLDTVRRERTARPAGRPARHPAPNPRPRLPPARTGHRRP